MVFRAEYTPEQNKIKKNESPRVLAPGLIAYEQTMLCAADRISMAHAHTHSRTRIMGRRSCNALASMRSHQ